MEVGDVVQLSPSILRWAPEDTVKREGLIVGVVHHEILNASVYEVMWNDGRIRREYSSDIRAIPHVL